MEERRQQLRQDTSQTAYITGDGASTRCKVVNISEAGAAIEVPEPAYVRDRFVLKIEDEESLRYCRVVWIRENRIGVMFVSPPAKTPTA